MTDPQARLSGSGRHDRAASAVISTYVRELLAHEAPQPAAVDPAAADETTASPEPPQGSEVAG
jgi:hypothetical protein